MQRHAVLLVVLALACLSRAELLRNPSAETGPAPDTWKAGDPWNEENDPEYWIAVREGRNTVYGPVGGWAAWKQQGYQPAGGQVSPPAKDGQRYLLAKADVEGTWGGFYQDVAGVAGGDDITFAAWYRSEPGAAAPQPYLYIDWLDAVGAVIETDSAGPLGGGQPTSTWTRYELRAVAPAAAAKASFMVAAKAEKDTGGGCLFDGMSAYLTNGARYPSPANRGYANPALPVTLSWEKASGICSVYFGQSPAALDQVVANQDVTSYNAGSLERGAVYYWRVDTPAQTGKLWSFKYGNPAPIDTLDRYLKMHVKFDEATGTLDAVTGRWGTFKDTSGATVPGALPLEDGVAGQAINTDYRLYVEYEDDPGFLADLGSEFTLALWARAVNPGGIAYLFAKHRNLALMRQNNTGYPRFDVSLAGSGGAITRAQVRADTEGIDFLDGQWWHIAVSYLDETLTIYLNGQRINSAEYPGAGAFTTEDWGADEDLDVSIGTILRPNEINRAWNGLLDEVRVYSIGFTERNVADLLDSYGLTNVCAEFPVGDLNEDCYVDFTDLAILCSNWLACTDISGNCH